MNHLAANEKLFQTTDSLMAVLADCLARYNRVYRNYALAKTFLTERLEHLVEYNLLQTYFKAVSLMPLEALDDAPHTKPAFFTPARVVFMREHQSSLDVYFSHLGEQFNQAFKAACEREQPEGLVANIGLFGSALNSPSRQEAELEMLENRDNLEIGLDKYCVIVNAAIESEEQIHVGSQNITDQKNIFLPNRVLWEC